MSKEKRILLAGFGGQGIIFMGKLLALAAMKEGKNVTWMPSYGAEVRGGTAHSMVVVSDEEIAVPYVREPDLCVVMNNPSLERFEEAVKKGGEVFVNISLCDTKIKRKDVKVVEIPATRLAQEIGNANVANMIMLGALTAETGLCNLKTLIDCLEEVVPTHRKDLIPLNKRALEEGASLSTCKR
ncbi:MAG: 2-oxoacid:acceptor oxidoreductase family protein [Candidatus Omnitrophota bacterium]